MITATFSATTKPDVVRDATTLNVDTMPGGALVSFRVGGDERGYNVRVALSTADMLQIVAEASAQAVAALQADRNRREALEAALQAAQAALPVRLP